jgi:peptide-methionine (S)-S-oxide reductase
MNRTSISSKSRTPFFVAVVMIAIVVALLRQSQATESATLVPPPSIDEPAPNTQWETAVVAGGCFWGVQGVFQHVKGVTQAVSGYTGGESTTARYEDVGLGSTGHAESVKITFDPKQITYGQILQIYFSVAHDPTQLNRQGPDRGTQYRSAIFPTSDAQQKTADAYISQINGSHVFTKPLATRVEPGKTFYSAEAYHQDFLALNPGYGYIVVNDLPKIANLERVFPDRFRQQPVLVNPTPR